MKMARIGARSWVRIALVFLSLLALYFYPPWPEDNDFTHQIAALSGGLVGSFRDPLFLPVFPFILFVGLRHPLLAFLATILLSVTEYYGALPWTLERGRSPFGLFIRWLQLGAFITLIQCALGALADGARQMIRRKNAA